MTPELEAAWRAEFDAWYLKKYPLVEGYGHSSNQIRIIKEYDEWPAYLAAKRADHAEIARLREALNHVADEIVGQMQNGCLRDGSIGSHFYWMQVAVAARAALEQPPAVANEPQL